MIPSLVVGDIRKALVEYLASTFALSDDEVRDALSQFLADGREGIFRGPYLRVRTPYLPVGGTWKSPLEWNRDGFIPFAHQAAAFERLASADGGDPEPTIVTTGTGSGKTECFLYPILDHCAREKAKGTQGIKALILYPMNALASDQANRLAELLWTEPGLAGVTAGLYVGGTGRHSSAGEDHLVDQREVLRANPPDILLTNYKMLDFLLLRPEDRDLWALNQADTLRYVVLDEFHTYDGAQGTDVAMLLRRLGRTLGTATPDRPLGTAAPVATSATLGTGATSIAELRDFAGKVFGVDFDEESVITERRQSVEEALGPIDFNLSIPAVDEVVDATELDEVAAAFCRRVDTEESPTVDDVVALGEALLAHPLTRAVLAAVGERPRSWAQTVQEVVTRAPEWGRVAMTDPGRVEQALSRFLWLLSIARRRQGSQLRPLLSVEVQLWIREVSRLLRSVDDTRRFRWRDSAALGLPGDDEDGSPPVLELPAVYCRRCGLSGWMAVQSELGDTLITSAETIYRAAVQRKPTVRALIGGNPEDPAVSWFDARSRSLVEGPDKAVVAVHVTKSEDDAKNQTCPACDERDAIRFLGSQVASLASVSINTMFGSPHVADEEPRLLAFTDSVQDASHRASFFAGRTHRINLRSLMAGIIRERVEVSLAELGDELHVAAATQHDRYALIPPDLMRDPLARTTWSDEPDPAGLEMLRRRLRFEADIEFGLRSRVGRTLELSGVAAATVDLPDLDAVLSLLAEDLRAVPGDDYPADAPFDTWLRGLLERLRLRGGIDHPWLRPYVEDDGRLWFVWGGRPGGLPPFTPGQGRPLFFTTAGKGDFDSLTARGSTRTWLVDWTVRSLGVEDPVAATMLQRVMALLAHQTEAVSERQTKAGKVYALAAEAITIHDLSSDDDPVGVRCGLCGSRHPAPVAVVDTWLDTPCLRYRCTGAYEIDPPPPHRFYRDLYRSGVTRRVVTGEHTGLLDRQNREELEDAFRSGTAPDSPNVIVATPTLEMGIDIGDLSAVMLTSVPPSASSYIQRVGRAGRKTGNSLITTFVTADTHGLYYLAEPEAMIAGDVRPPNCYLDAAETLRRQYTAYLFDRVADLSIDAPPIQPQIRSLMAAGIDEGSLLRRIVEVSALDPDAVAGFLDLFGDRLSDETADRLRDWASSGIEQTIKAAIDRWRDHERDLVNRQRRLTEGIDRATEAGEESEVVSSLLGQRTVVRRLLADHRNQYTLSALERLGILPNYTLVDDTATLTATLWWTDAEGEYESESTEYARAAGLAVREFAPGNSFYAGGHRHVVDALEIGTADEPLYETWRLCPDCGFGTLEGEEPPTACPRCGAAAILDVGSRQTLLPMKAALSTDSEERARVYDERDDRDRENYETLTSVDIDPAHTSGSWRLGDKVFGAERADVARLRTYNFGFAERPGDRIPIAGADRHVTGFEICRHCGAARDARDDKRGERPDRLHQGWCKVRSGAARERWDSIVLYHELETEAVRMLLPVSMFEIDERLVSFKGALLLGLRADFGGDPDHLEIARTDLPNRGGQGRRQFLVLFDNVPGGTGYLSRLADPDRLRSILTSAREIVSKCPCQAEGRAACHRCLLGVIDRWEYDLARRDLAIALLDDLLGDWNPEPVAALADIDIGAVEESELERRFKVALRAWAGKEGDEKVTLKPVPADSGSEAFELRLTGPDGQAVRYKIEEQVDGIMTSPNTVPDFVITRQDAKAPKVAVYLDGFQFHASSDHNVIGQDAAKRAGLRSTGMLVWNLTWDDVEAFHSSVEQELSKEPRRRRLFGPGARNKAKVVQQQNHGRLGIDDAERNPYQLLLQYLADPDGDAWERLALSLCAGLWADAAPQHLPESELVRVGEAVLAGQAVDFIPGEGAVVLARPVTENDLVLALLFDSAKSTEERWAVLSILPDDDETVASDEHRTRWQDWLQWANLAQFIRGVGRDVVIGTATQDLEPFDELWIAAHASSAVTVPEDESPVDEVELTAEMEEELEFVVDDAVRTLARVALAAGAPVFTAGYETQDGDALEAAWPEQRIAVVPDEVDIAVEGWDVRSAGDWTVDELVEATKANG